MHYLALCCIAKDEDPFLKEWLTVHSLLGVEHFYIYDNCSKNLIREQLEDFASGARVTVRRVEGRQMQIPVYNDCLKSFGDTCRWIGFIDIDEFVYPLQDNDLRVLLAEFEQYGGLAATWHLIGPSGHLRRPEGPVIRNYTQAFAVQESFIVKSFVQPPRTAQCCDPHTFQYVPGHHCVNEEHYPVSPGQQFTFATGKKVRVNHYFLRSQQDFEQKIERGGGARDESKRLEMIMFYQSAARAWVEDNEIQRLLPALEAALRNDTLPPPPFIPPRNIGTAELLELASAFNDAGQYEKALACLCHPDSQHAEKADFLILRALLAQTAGQLERAEIFIRQALEREGTETAFALLRVLFKSRGREDLAGGIDTILRRYSKDFS